MPKIAARVFIFIVLYQKVSDNSRFDHYPILFLTKHEVSHPISFVLLIRFSLVGLGRIFLAEHEYLVFLFFRNTCKCNLICCLYIVIIANNTSLLSMSGSKGYNPIYWFENQKVI